MCRDVVPQRFCLPSFCCFFAAPRGNGIGNQGECEIAEASRGCVGVGVGAGATCQWVSGWLAGWLAVGVCAGLVVCAREEGVCVCQSERESDRGWGHRRGCFGGVD